MHEIEVIRGNATNTFRVESWKEDNRNTHEYCP